MQKTEERKKWFEPRYYTPAEKDVVPGNRTAYFFDNFSKMFYNETDKFFSCCIRKVSLKGEPYGT
ncbi:MAG: hypothetical protein ACOYVJ_00130 [Nitrospirota bacterium]